MTSVFVIIVAAVILVGVGRWAFAKPAKKAEKADDRYARIAAATAGGSGATFVRAVSAQEAFAQEARAVVEAARRDKEAERTRVAAYHAEAERATFVQAPAAESAAPTFVDSAFETTDRLEVEVEDEFAPETADEPEAPRAEGEAGPEAGIDLVTDDDRAEADTWVAETAARVAELKAAGERAADLEEIRAMASVAINEAAVKTPAAEAPTATSASEAAKAAEPKDGDILAGLDLPVSEGAQEVVLQPRPELVAIANEKRRLAEFFSAKDVRKRLAGAKDGNCGAAEARHRCRGGTRCLVVKDSGKVRIVGVCGWADEARQTVDSGIRSFSDKEKAREYAQRLRERMRADSQREQEDAALRAYFDEGSARERFIAADPEKCACGAAHECGGGTFHVPCRVQEGVWTDRKTCGKVKDVMFRSQIFVKFFVRKDEAEVFASEMAAEEAQEAWDREQARQAKETRDRAFQAVVAWWKAFLTGEPMAGADLSCPKYEGCQGTELYRSITWQRTREGKVTHRGTRTFGFCRFGNAAYHEAVSQLQREGVKVRREDYNTSHEEMERETIRRNAGGRSGQRCGDDGRRERQRPVMAAKKVVEAVASQAKPEPATVPAAEPEVEETPVEAQPEPESVDPAEAKRVETERRETLEDTRESDGESAEKALAPKGGRDRKAEKKAERERRARAKAEAEKKADSAASGHHGDGDIPVMNGFAAAKGAEALAALRDKLPSAVKEETPTEKEEEEVASA